MLPAGWRKASELHAVEEIKRGTPMTQNFLAETRITIHAPAEAVWRALTDAQEAADTMAEKNWGPVLEGIKKVAEQ
jgi:hypothetical protein